MSENMPQNQPRPESRPPAVVAGGGFLISHQAPQKAIVIPLPAWKRIKEDVVEIHSPFRIVELLSGGFLGVFGTGVFESFNSSGKATFWSSNAGVLSLCCLICFAVFLYLGAKERSFEAKTVSMALRNMESLEENLEGADAAELKVFRSRSIWGEQSHKLCVWALSVLPWNKT
jgi:hypothetical protein